VLPNIFDLTINFYFFWPNNFRCCSWYQREIWFVGVSWTLKKAEKFFTLLTFGCPSNRLCVHWSILYRAGLNESEAPGKVVTARPPKRLAQLRCIFTRPRSLQARIVAVFLHVTRASTTGFFHPDLLFSRPGCLGLIMKNHFTSGFFEVVNSSPTSVCSII